MNFVVNFHNSIFLCITLYDYTLQQKHIPAACDLPVKIWDAQIPSVIWNSELSIIPLRLGLAMFYEHSVKDCGGLGKLVKTGTEINIELFLYMYGKW